MIKLIRKLIQVFRVYDKIIGIERLNKELINADLYNSTIQNSSWLIDKSFSPGRWAVGYIFLYVLYRILNELKPLHIVEFGIGQSTRMLSQYADYNSEALMTSYEHDQEWIDFVSKSFLFSNKIQIILTNLVKTEYKGFKVTSYELKKLSDEKFQLIILDGPFGSTRYSRIQVLQLIPEHLDINNFCILMDDYDRQGEQDTAKEICTFLDMASVKYRTKVYSGQKDVFVICSESNKFIASL